MHSLSIATCIVNVLDFIRSHIEPQATYRLGAADLEYGELLPEKPASLEQEDYEERTAVGFHLERLTKRVGELVCSGAPAAAGYELPAPYKATRVDVENGPEIIRIDRMDESE